MTTASARPRTASRRFELGFQLQAPQRVVPHALERGTQGAQSLAARAVVAVLVLATTVHEARRAERAQLQGDR
ncbi:MAG TPA: hypothetical protein VH439_10430, partial [Gemmatimonadales bacterium]